MFEPLLSWVPTLSQFSAFSPLSESAVEVSDVRPNSQSFSINIERHMVRCQKHQFDLAARQIASTVLGAESAAKESGAGSNGHGCSQANTIALSRLQS
jgi:hypothetical protein